MNSTTKPVACETHCGVAVTRARVQLAAAAGRPSDASTACQPAGSSIVSPIAVRRMQGTGNMIDQRAWARAASIAMFTGLVLLSACGGGGNGGAAGGNPNPPQPPSLMSQADATRLLEQGTFGPTAADVQHVQQVGASVWIDEQLALPATGYQGFSYVTHAPPANCVADGNPSSAATLCSRSNYSLFEVQRRFFVNALTGPDQLRQRVAWALSQIFVVSGTEIYEAYGMAAYQNMLLNDAFGNYRQLLEDVTLSPVMGRYLDMVNNDIPDPAKGTTPNENYAREVMQLFSIGVQMLNADGTAQLDGQGQPIPTYGQAVVESFASLFTGWTFPPLPGTASQFGNAVNYQAAMVSFPAHHSTDAKSLLPGCSLPAGQTPEQDLKGGLDCIFQHPNVGPFISRRLIQHLVTSNPTPAYVSRVAAVFANDGNGVRGNLAAVVTSILLDAEARGDAPSVAGAGHYREPALFITTLLRALGGQSDGVYLRAASAGMSQNVFIPPTVFNYYPPGFTLPGTQTLAPEFFIANAATALNRANFVNRLIFGGGAAPDSTVTGATGTTLDLTLLANSADATTLINNLSAALLHGSLSGAAASTIAVAAQTSAPTATSAGLGQAQIAAYLVATSPQFQVER
jgi:uncharacterized protein (DUF1800 family)